MAISRSPVVKTSKTQSSLPSPQCSQAFSAASSSTILLALSSHELRRLQEWTESDKLIPTVSNVYDFSVSGVRAAFDEISSRRAIGKVVVHVLAEEDAGVEQELSKQMQCDYARRKVEQRYFVWRWVTGA